MGPIAVYVLDLERRSNENVVLHLVSNAVTREEKILCISENKLAYDLLSTKSFL